MIRALLVCLALATPVQAAAEESWMKHPESCRYGPVQRTFAGTDWLVYGCEPDATLYIFAAPDNPAAPARIVAFPFEYGGYRIIGPGAANQSPHWEAAADAVAETPGDELRALYAKARAMGSP